MYDMIELQTPVLCDTFPPAFNSQHAESRIGSNPTSTEQAKLPSKGTGVQCINQLVEILIVDRVLNEQLGSLSFCILNIKLLYLS